MKRAELPQSFVAEGGCGFRTGAAQHIAGKFSVACGIARELPGLGRKCRTLRQRWIVRISAPLEFLEFCAVHASGVSTTQSHAAPGIAAKLWRKCRDCLGNQLGISAINKPE